MVKDKIEEKLITGITVLFLDVINESPNHNVEPGSESHFKVVIVSDDFIDLKAVKRHQKVYEVLSEEMKIIHAIAIHPFTSEEWKERTGDSLDSPLCLGGDK